MYRTGWVLEPTVKLESTVFVLPALSLMDAEMTLLPEGRGVGIWYVALLSVIVKRLVLSAPLI
jgi:hypothetical protein